MTYKVLVCGGRDYNNSVNVWRTLDELHGSYGKISHVIHGAARGADERGGSWARDVGVQEVACPANWSKHGPRAGFLRNAAMAALKPDLVVAFPGGRGTAMMVQLAHEEGIEVLEVK